MKLFNCDIQDSQLEFAIDLPHWSHASQPFDKFHNGTLYRKIYFSARTRTEAARELQRCFLKTTNLSEGKNI